jgi:predicted DNA-binding protein (UPF0251 family)
MPDILYFKPAGIAASELDEVTLTLDEMEAVRLADLEGLYHEEASFRMNVSRQTFANILNAAHRKTAEALICGKALRIEGGNVEMKETPFTCFACSHAWIMPAGTERPTCCPLCSDGNIHPDCAGLGPEGSGCRQKKQCCRRRQKEESHEHLHTHRKK